jgi:hypothetical protein
VSERLTEVKLVDHQGRPLCVLEWDVGGEFRDDVRVLGEESTEPAARMIHPHWRVRPKPQSRKSKQHSDSQLREHNISMTPAGHSPKLPARYLDGHIAYLDLPGLTVRWEKVEAVLETVAEDFPGHRAITLTLKEFRRRLG